MNWFGAQSGVYCVAIAGYYYSSLTRPPTIPYLIFRFNVNSYGVWNFQEITQVFSSHYKRRTYERRVRLDARTRTPFLSKTQIKP